MRAHPFASLISVDDAGLPFVSQKVSSHIINEVRGIKRVTYDISRPPPATIEWE